MTKTRDREYFAYRAHGELIRSQLPLPEYSPAESDDRQPLFLDLSSSIDPLPSEQGAADLPDGYRLWWSGIGDFSVLEDGPILCRRMHGVSDALFRLPMLGTVLAAALAMRRRFTLHGNAVCINGRAVIIVGHKGQGKTTLTACLLKRGHPLVADDVSAFTLDTTGASVHRGSLHLRLWADSIEQIFGGPADRFEQFSADYPKRIVPANAFTVDRPTVPLAGILCLRESDDLLLEKMSTADAWRQVVVHSLQSRLGSKFLKTKYARWHHEQCANLVRVVPIHYLHRPRGFGRLNEVAEFIEHAFA